MAGIGRGESQPITVAVISPWSLNIFRLGDLVDGCVSTSLNPLHLNSLNSSGNSLLSIQAFIPSANSSGHYSFHACTAPFTTKALLSSQPPLKTCPNLRVPSTSSCL